MAEPSTLLGAPLRAINVGLSLFAEVLRARGVEVVEVDWRPPAGGDARMLSLLERLRRAGGERGSKG
ncbi:MAG: fdrA domain protein [Nitrospinota bacterium]